MANPSHCPLSEARAPARVFVFLAFPLELKVPNAATRRAMAESDEMMRKGTARFASADEMFAELDEAARQ